MNADVIFRPDRIYEVTGLWTRQGKADQLQAYFGEVYPIAVADYGVRPVFSLAPVRAYAGDFMPDAISVNEWPSIDRFRAFVDDPRVRERIPTRDDALDHLVVSHYSVPEEGVVTITDGDLVEFAAMWIKAGREEELSRYYESVVPIARERGLVPMTPLRPVASYRGRFMPSRAGLNLWKTAENFDAFAEAAAPLFPSRDVALDRLEVTHASVRLPR